MEVHWHHGLALLDAVIVRRWLFILGDRSLVEAPGVFTLRALGVVGLVIGAHAMEQSCPHSGPHYVNITVDILGDGIAVVMLQPYGLLFGEATMSTTMTTRLMLLCQLQKGRSHLLVGVVDTFFFYYGDVGTIGCHSDKQLPGKPWNHRHPMYIKPMMATERPQSRFAASTSIALELP